MEELTIEDKKYVSSKRAAQMTGYAKDYIGQLCREGRVPARLVGRSWYVLESAIQDHRFGVPDQQPEPASVPATEPSESSDVLPSTWEAPRYEAAESSPVPLNRLEDPQYDREPVPRAQDAWKEWFDRFDTDNPTQQPAAVVEGPEPAPTVPEEVGDELVEDDSEVRIPIHIAAGQAAPYQLPPQELLPSLGKTILTEDLKEEPRDAATSGSSSRSAHRRLTRTLRVASIVLAFCMISLAVLGSGVFDAYIISGGRVGLLAGVSLYNK